jgi:guanine nucleotide-binding protein subunit alpha
MAPAIMCFGKKPQDPRARKNEEIEKSLRADRKRQEREVKLLLLGTMTNDIQSGQLQIP